MVNERKLLNQGFNTDCVCFTGSTGKGNGAYVGSNRDYVNGNAGMDEGNESLVD